jgi:hypothetical protein
LRANADGIPLTLLEFTEALIGLILVALLIAYLPTMYAAFSRRESAVTLLEVRAGNPPSASEMLQRFHRIHGLHQLGEQWRAWEAWFADVEESHTSLPALVSSVLLNRSFLDHCRRPRVGYGCLTLAAVDTPHDFQADLCLRAGYLALRRIADFFGIPYNPDPHYPADTISIRQEEFEACLDTLQSAGLPLKEAREQAWRSYAGWRVNYDAVLLALAGLVMAPEAPWSSDRIPAYDYSRPPFLLRKIKNHIRKAEKNPYPLVSGKTPES